MKANRIRLVPGTTIPYENWIQAWIVANITKRKEIKEEKRREKNWSQMKHEKKVFEPIDFKNRDRQERINSYLTADVPDERDLESVKERTKQTMILKGALDKKDFENKQTTKDNDHD